jgi:hypothetical protein
MLRTLPELLIGPLLVAIATLAARRWGPRVGGLLSAFPAVVGPVLLILAEQRGVGYAARAANGTLLGLVTLSGFALTYARAAVRSTWAVSLAAGWLAAALLGVLVTLLGDNAGFPAALLVASLSLLGAHRAMPGRHAGHSDTSAVGLRSDLVLRIAATAALVLVLTLVAEAFGPLVGGVATALPILASVLTSFTHRTSGSEAAVALLRGILLGMAGFVAFCSVVATLLATAGVVASFVTAALLAGAVQGLSLRRPALRARHETRLS